MESGAVDGACGEQAGESGTSVWWRLPSSAWLLAARSASLHCTACTLHGTAMREVK